MHISYIIYIYILYIYTAHPNRTQVDPSDSPTPTAELPGRCVHQVPRLGDSTESRGFGLDGLDEDGGIVEKRYFQRNKKCKVESIVGFMFFCGHEISIAFYIS